MDTTPISRPAPTLAVRLAIIAGLLWSLFGVFQFASQNFTDRDGLVAGGMTLAQANLYAGLPLWMGAVFAVGTIGGALGCVLLLTGRSAAVPVLATSLAAYVALYLGDIVYGVFALFGWPQIIVLTLVVIIAAALLWTGTALARQGKLA